MEISNYDKAEDLLTEELLNSNYKTLRENLAKCEKILNSAEFRFTQYGEVLIWSTSQNAFIFHSHLNDASEEEFLRNFALDQLQDKEN